MELAFTRIAQRLAVVADRASALVDEVVGTTKRTVVRDELTFVRAQLDAIGPGRTAALRDACAALTQLTVQLEAAANHPVSASRSLRSKAFTDAIDGVRHAREHVAWASERRDILSLPPEQARVVVRDAFGEVLDLHDGEITVNHVRRLAWLADLPTTHRPALPPARGFPSLADLASWGGIPSSMPQAEGRFTLLRAWSIAERIDADRTMTRARLLERLDDVLARSRDGINPNDAAWIAALDQLRGPQANMLPPPTGASRLHDAIEHGFDDLGLAELRGWRWMQRIREATSGELRQVVDELADVLPWHIERAELDALAAVAAIDDGRRIGLPDDLVRTIREVTSPGFVEQTDEIASTFDELRLWRDRSRLLADPSFSPERADELVRRVVVSGADEVTADQLYVAAAAATLRSPLGATLPIDVRRVQVLAHDSQVRASATRFADTFAPARLHIARERLLSDPNLTRSEVVDRIARIVSRPLVDASHDDVVELAALATLPAHLAPAGAIPSPPWTQDLIGARARSGAQLAAFEQARSWLLDSGDDGIDAVRSIVRDGEPVDLALADRVTGAGIRSAIPVTDDDLLRSAAASLTEVATRPFEQSVPEIMRLRSMLRDRATSDSTRPIVEDAIRLLDRNSRRHQRDSYLDYAELGRVRTMVDLVIHLDGAPAPPARIAGTGSITW